MQLFIEKNNDSYDVCSTCTYYKNYTLNNKDEYNTLFSNLLYVENSYGDIYVTSYANIIDNIYLKRLFTKELKDKEITYTYLVHDLVPLMKETLAKVYRLRKTKDGESSYCEFAIFFKDKCYFIDRNFLIESINERYNSDEMSILSLRRYFNNLPLKDFLKEFTGVSENTQNYEKYPFLYLNTKEGIITLEYKDGNIKKLNKEEFKCLL